MPMGVGTKEQPDDPAPSDPEPQPLTTLFAYTYEKLLCISVLMIDYWLYSFSFLFCKWPLTNTVLHMQVGNVFSLVHSANDLLIHKCNKILEMHVEKYKRMIY